MFCGRTGGTCCVRQEDSLVSELQQARASAESAHAAYTAKCAALWEEHAYKMSADSMYGLKAPEVAGKREDGSQASKARRVCVTVSRDSVKDSLGIHVKHVDGKLVLVGILSDGAVHRSVAHSMARGGDTLETGDTIVQINNVREDDAAMVQECKDKAVLVIHALRTGS